MIKSHIYKARILRSSFFGFRRDTDDDKYMYLHVQIYYGRLKKHPGQKKLYTYL